MISMDCPAGDVLECLFCLARRPGDREPRRTVRASPIPIVSTRELPPKLPLLPIVRKTDRGLPSDPFNSTCMLAPRAERLVWRPMSLLSASGEDVRDSETGR